MMESGLITLLEGDGQGELTASQMPQEPQGGGCILQTLATRKASDESLVEQSLERAALLAPFKGVAPANTSWACFRKEGGEAAFWVTASQDLLTQGTRHPGSVLTERGGCRLQVFSDPYRGKDRSQPGSEIALEGGSRAITWDLWKLEVLGGEKKRSQPWNPTPGEARSHPGQASGTRRGCQAWEGRRMSRGGS